MVDLEKATFGGGCFWCFEAIYQRLNGVDSAVSGYAGGDVDDPSYEQVSSGNSGHAEVVQLTFDPNVISYETLLKVFWKMHDPTTLNKQGNDVGAQYRSVIFYHNDEQKKLAETSKTKIEEEGMYADDIVTEILPFERFYTAEEYHQNFYNNNENYGYCTVIIKPKLEKLEKEFSDIMKK